MKLLMCLTMEDDYGSYLLLGQQNTTGSLRQGYHEGVSIRHSDELVRD